MADTQWPPLPGYGLPGSPTHAEVLATGIPKATLVRWEGVGHEQAPQLVPELTRLVIQHIDAAS
jgi:hypothetical protein